MRFRTLPHIARLLHMKQLRLPANMLPFGIVEADIQRVITALISPVQILLLVCREVIRTDLGKSLVKFLTHTVTGVVKSKFLAVLVTVVKCPVDISGSSFSLLLS